MSQVSPLLGPRSGQHGSSCEGPCASQRWHPTDPEPRGGASPAVYFLLRGSCGIRLTVSAQTASMLSVPSCPACFPAPSSPVWRIGSRTNRTGIWACFQYLRACDHQTICTGPGSLIVTTIPGVKHVGVQRAEGPPEHGPVICRARDLTPDCRFTAPPQPRVDGSVTEQP